MKSASKNVKDGISLVKTAEGAMQEVQDMLNRMVSLATPAPVAVPLETLKPLRETEKLMPPMVTVTLPPATAPRANLQAEVEQLKSEINRIADSANFNGINLLDGSKEIKTTYIWARIFSEIARPAASSPARLIL